MCKKPGCSCVWVSCCCCTGVKCVRKCMWHAPDSFDYLYKNCGGFFSSFLPSLLSPLFRGSMTQAVNTSLWSSKHTGHSRLWEYEQSGVVRQDPAAGVEPAPNKRRSIILFFTPVGAKPNQNTSKQSDKPCACTSYKLGNIGNPAPRGGRSTNLFECTHESRRTAGEIFCPANIYCCKCYAARRRKNFWGPLREIVEVLRYLLSLLC